LLCGVPLLLIPFFGDQHGNAQKIESGKHVVQFIIGLMTPRCCSWRWPGYAVYLVPRSANECTGCRWGCVSSIRIFFTHGQLTALLTESKFASNAGKWGTLLQRAGITFALLGIRCSTIYRRFHSCR
jgi:hypothetical protein